MAGLDRDKALDMALANIEKQYGKGSVMRLGDDQRPAMKVIPTGSIALDVALGVGGLPRGRVIEIYGPESSGKCLTADTYLWTDRGLETITELFARCGQKASCTSRVTDIRDLGVRVVNERGELEHVASLTHNNKRPVVRVTVSSGRVVTATHNHPLRVMNNRGFIVWRKAGELKVGDMLVSGTFGAVEAAHGDGLSEDEAVLLGYLVAEGSLGYKDSIRFTNWDPEVAGEYTRLAESLFGITVRNYGDPEHVIFNVKLRRQLYSEFGMDYVNAPGKTIPARVRTSGHKVQRAFLSALFEGDGWIDPSSTVGLGTASEQLAREIQLMLYGLGIPSSVYTKFNQTYQRNYWSVIVNPAVAQRFLTEVGFRSERRRKQVELNFRPAARDPEAENVPHVATLLRDLRDSSGIGSRDFDRIAGDLFRSDLALGCSRRRLAKIVDFFDARSALLAPAGQAIVEYLRHLGSARHTYERITAIEDGGVQPTFDIVLPETHSFLANGILSHNTTVALHAVASAQAAGGIAAFIDAEHALDPDYAKALGVDTDALLVSQPDTGEQALEITDMLVRSGALDIVVIDSVAALVPRAEIEGEMGDSHVGLQARLMSQALRKLTGALSNSGTTLIFINQLREKIGVMFGCGSYHTKVTLADGSQESLGKIVNQKLPVEVLSYDVETGAIVPKRVVNWFNNGKTPEFLQFKVARAAGGKGRAYASLAMTPNHLIRTPGGWREAGKIHVGDRVMLSQPHRLSPQQWQVVLGGLMGDGSLSQPVKRDGSSARYRMGHGTKQVEYLDWKAALLANIKQCRTTNLKGACFVDLQPLAELAELRAAVYVAGQKVISWDYLKSLTPLALAIWYMDAGSFTLRSKGVQSRTAGGSGRVAFCVEAMSEGSRDRLVAYLRDTHELDVSWRRAGTRGKAVLTFSTAASARFLEMVAPYVHPSMDYKLLPRLRGLCTVEPQFVDPIMRPVPAEVVDIRVRDDFQSMNRFDIEVAGSHNYLADGVIVHNSPETTTGGKALKFYASVRLDVRRIETLKDGTDAVGNRTRIKVVKNKCLAEGSLIFDPISGMTRRIEDIVDNRIPVSVVAAAKDNTLHVRPVTSWFDQGEQDVIGLRLQGGTDLWVTPDHQVLTDLGWQLAGNLDPGDRVARPRQFPGLGGWSQDGYLARDVIDPILGHLDRRGVTPHDAAVMVGPAAGDPVHGMKQVLGGSLLRRDRVQALADGLADEFLKGLLAEEVCYSAVREVLPVRRCRTFDVEVEELHTLVADGVVVHNCSPPFKQAEFDIIYGQGISREGSLIDVGVEQGFIRKAGAWYTYDGDQLGQGKENARSFLKDNPDLADEIEKKIKEKLGIGPVLDVDLPIDVAPVDF